MITSEQRNFLRIHGYRVGNTCRQPEGYAVEYPRVRADAFCKRYSVEVFESTADAWAHAWAEATRDPVIATKWYQRMADEAASSMFSPFIPMDEHAFAPA